jgi:hypothetical protein
VMNNLMQPFAPPMSGQSSAPMGRLLNTTPKNQSGGVSALLALYKPQGVTTQKATAPKADPMQSQSKAPMQWGLPQFNV